MVIAPPNPAAQALMQTSAYKNYSNPFSVTPIGMPTAQRPVAGPTITSGGGSPSAPSIQQSQFYGSPSSLAGGSTVGQLSWTGGTGYQKILNPNYDPRSPGQNSQRYIYRYTGAPASGGGSTTQAPAGLPNSAASGGAGAAPTTSAVPDGVIGTEQNPFYATLQSAANIAGAAAGGQGASNLGQADMLRGGAGAVMNTAFDPQNELRSREEQRLQDKVRVGQAARGITMSPYGAGLESDAMSNFALDWQDRQLGRQTAGLGAATPASTAAFNVGQGGIGQYGQAGQLPYEAFQRQQDQNIQNWLRYEAMRQGQVGQAIQNFPNQIESYGNNTNPYIPTYRY